jgi:hypothetical protein
VQIVTSLVTEGTQFAVVGGDFNGYPHQPEISPGGNEPSAYIVLPLGNVPLNVAGLVDDSVED